MADEVLEAWELWITAGEREMDLEADAAGAVVKIGIEVPGANQAVANAASKVQKLLASGRAAATAMGMRAAGVRTGVRKPLVEQGGVSTEEDGAFLTLVR